MWYSKEYCRWVVACRKTNNDRKVVVVALEVVVKNAAEVVVKNAVVDDRERPAVDNLAT